MKNCLCRLGNVLPRTAQAPARSLRNFTTSTSSSFHATSTLPKRHQLSQMPPPYTPPPPFPSPTASGIELQAYREPPPTVPPPVDPLLHFLTNLIMRHGHRERAAKHVSLCLSHLRLVTGQEGLPLLRKAVELASPNVMVKTEKRKVKSTLVPVALNERQRVRRGIVWILKQSDRRLDKRLGARLALEVIAVLNGNSEVLRQKTTMHKDATINRSSLRRQGARPN